MAARAPAYRLLGSLAEDVVQETYARWYAMSRDEQDAIAAPGAWLTKVAGRLCLNVLSSAHARRETYVGEWIPEPVPDSREWCPADPADRVTLDESVSMAARRRGQLAARRRGAADDLGDFGERIPEDVVQDERDALGRRHRVGSSGTSNGPGKHVTSRPSSACSPPTPRRSATAAAW
ncbi:hypothetical protein GCM10022380_75000 [Amycolatopsis tucumanensis]|uniref:RNA polymerase sigma-70 region 2 domain-containing protein n=1 Tax=Amycolatopsis tucumanensis TaxID=401106 RepID=A0ABP7JIK5_9PSEU